MLRNMCASLGYVGDLGIGRGGQHDCLNMLKTKDRIADQHGFEMYHTHSEPSKTAVFFPGAPPSGSPRSRSESRVCSVPVSDIRADAEP